jgi:hypothetical protein
VGRCGLDAFGSEHGPAADSYERGNKLSGSIRGGEFLDKPSDYQLLKKEVLCSMSWLVGWLVKIFVSFQEECL